MATGIVTSIISIMVGLITNSYLMWHSALPRMTAEIVQDNLFDENELILQSLSAYVHQLSIFLVCGLIVYLLVAGLLSMKLMRQGIKNRYIIFIISINLTLFVLAAFVTQSFDPIANYVLSW
ncbi:MAG: hypothetical protein L0Y62_05370 [Nitrospirae bacterium]|nr:hypothetical protein [Nitrospirota bacterium]